MLKILIAFNTEIPCALFHPLHTLIKFLRLHLDFKFKYLRLHLVKFLTLF